MIRVVSSNFTSHHLIQLREWFISEWGTFENFEDSKLGIVHHIVSPGDKHYYRLLLTGQIRLRCKHNDVIAIYFNNYKEENYEVNIFQ